MCGSFTKIVLMDFSLQYWHVNLTCSLAKTFENNFSCTLTVGTISFSEIQNLRSRNLPVVMMIKRFIYCGVAILPYYQHK